VPGKINEVFSAEELALKRGLAKQETRRPTKNCVINVEEGCFDFRRRGLGHGSSLVVRRLAYP
jgi:hypothetical protein